MNILYDGEIYGLQKQGGINRYFDHLISGLPKDFQPILTSIRSRDDEHPYHPNLKLISYKRFGFRPGRVSYFLEPFYFRVAEAISNYQIIHPTYYSLLTRENFSKKQCPIVITVYDMIHEIFADSMDEDGAMAEMKRKAISAADMVLCISESTKRDLLERYSLPDERVRVTHLAAEFNADTKGDHEPIPSRPFFLYVGARFSYKNFSTLLTAISELTSKIPDILIAVVGSPFKSSEKKLIEAKNLGNYIQNFGYTSDSHLIKLYKNCIAFVYPSLYEGFGIPPLEAMICKAPVIASNTSSIPEVVGDAGLLFDPYSVPDLVDRLMFVFNNPAERDRLISKGLVQSQKFSWDNTIARTIEAYQFIAG